MVVGKRKSAYRRDDENDDDDGDDDDDDDDDGGGGDDDDVSLHCVSLILLSTMHVIYICLYYLIPI